MTGADVVLLNEADHPATLDQLARELGMQSIWAHGSGTKHIALLSRLPILNWRIYNRRPITQALLEAELQIGKQTVRIYGVHLLPYFMLLQYELARWRTVSAILQVIKRNRSTPHLVMGDFNAVLRGERADLSIFPPRIHRRLRLQFNHTFHFALTPLVRARYTDAFRALHPNESGMTWMTTHASARLDYIFADPSFAARLRFCECVTAAPAVRASDHFPLVARFDLQDAPNDAMREI